MFKTLIAILFLLVFFLCLNSFCFDFDAYRNQQANLIKLPSLWIDYKEDGFKYAEVNVNKDESVSFRIDYGAKFKRKEIIKLMNFLNDVYELNSTNNIIAEYEEKLKKKDDAIIYWRNKSFNWSESYLKKKIALEELKQKDSHWFKFFWIKL